MWRGVEQAAALLLSGDRELYCILAVTARMSLCSSLLALALGALVFATLIGLISGYSPANRAVKISALEAIKNE